MPSFKRNVWDVNTLLWTQSSKELKHPQDSRTLFGFTVQDMCVYVAMKEWVVWLQRHVFTGQGQWAERSNKEQFDEENGL